MNNTVFFLLILLGAMPLMPTGILSITIIAYSISIIYLFFANPVFFNKNNFKYIISQISFYSVFCFSFLYSDDYGSGFRIIQHSLPLFVFPFLSIMSPKIEKKDLERIAKLFILSSSILAFYISISLLSKYGFYNVFNTSIVFHMIREQFFYIDIHPIYTSTYFIFSIILLINYILYNLNFKTILIAAPSLIFLILAITILASKTAILILLISIIGVILFSKNIALKYKFFCIITFLTIFLVALFNIKTINSRFFDLVNSFNKEYAVALNSNSTNLRVQIYTCAISETSNNFWFGVGLGDVQQTLNDCYNNKGFINKTISAHNFYLRILLSCGFIGLMLFIYSVVNNLKLAIHKGSSIFFHFGVLFVFLMFVEDYLIRAYGVSLYAVSNHLLYIYKVDIKQ